MRNDVVATSTVDI